MIAGKVQASSQEKPTILVVDDTPANLELMVGVLKTDYRVKVATSGEKALRIASTSAVDMILLDIQMPGMDGYEVCAHLKRSPETCHIPVIFVTTMGDVEDETHGLDLGGVDYLVKPISPAIVRARLRTHLLLNAQALEMASMIATLEAQAEELSNFNRTLEARVGEGVAELERLGRLKRFFSPPIIEALLSDSLEDPLKTHRREIVAVCLDLRGFTAFTETSDPEEVMSVIHEYHAAMGALVVAYGGTVERFTGDGIMVFLNDPVLVDDPAVKAIEMAIGMQAASHRLSADWKRRGYDLGMGIGIAQGYATIGAIGFEGRSDYGVIGTVTNLSARLCAEAAAGQILVSKRVLASVNEVVDTTLVGELTLKGFHKPVPAYSVIGYVKERDGAEIGQHWARRASDRVLPVNPGPTS